MKTEKNIFLKKVISVAVIMTVLYSGFAKGGNLNPPAGPDEGTMLDLDQVEPRISIPGSETPTGPFVISESGSYYLTGNRHASGNAINVEADNVSIDLMGYALVGPGKASGDNHGIYMFSRQNIQICNGTVTQFGAEGIYEASNDWGKNHKVLNVRVISNGDDGICLRNQGHTIKYCTAIGNGGRGIFAYNDSILAGNISYDNDESGVYANDGCIVKKNVTFKNEFGINAAEGSNVLRNIVWDCNNTGLIVYSNCLVKENTVCENTYGIRVRTTSGLLQSSSVVTANTACHNEYTGILVSEGPGTHVERNTVANNNTADVGGYAGIHTGEDCRILENVLRRNDYAQIYVTGSDNCIEHNLFTDGEYGLLFTANYNFYSQNRASGNSSGDYVNTLNQTDGQGNSSF